MLNFHDILSSLNQRSLQQELITETAPLLSANNGSPRTNPTYETLPLTGNVYIDGILWGGNRWGLERDRTLTYSFWGPGAESFDDDGFDLGLPAYPWLSHEIEAMEAALTTWSNVANISFARADDNNPNATLGFYSVDAGPDQPQGAFSAPSYIGMGIGYFNRTGFAWNRGSLQPGGEAFTVLLHELGHGLGLAHPHDSDGGSLIYPGVSSPLDTGDFGLNQGIYTVMSYGYSRAADNNDLFPGGDFGNEATPMAFDIAAIQYLYGANWDYRTGDDVYTLPGKNEAGTFYSCIWDAGGIDTISAGSISGDAIIDLRAATLGVGPGAGGYLSYVEDVSLVERVVEEDSDRRIFGGFTIANGVIIENAIGGNWHDQITGNQAVNTLLGQGGNDELYGLDAGDFLDGGSGDDLLDGGSGDDTLSGGLDNDILEGQSGNDTLLGQDGEDILIGATGDDFLLGGLGSDTLFGASGRDQFGFISSTEGVDAILDFVSGEDKILISATGFGNGLIDGELTANQFHLGEVATAASHRLLYDGSTGRLLFDADGVAGANPVAFATLSVGATLLASDIFVTA